MLIKSATKNSVDITDYSVQNFEGYFVPTQNLTALKLNVSGLTYTNTVSVTAVPCETVSNLVLDSTIIIADNTQYLNEYFAINLQAGKEYCVNVYWDDTPTYTKGSPAWKIQGAADSSIDGDDIVIYRALRDKTSNTADQIYSDTFTPTEDIHVLNFFTQYVDVGNQVRIVITENDLISLPGTLMRISAGDDSRYYSYAINAGTAYMVNVIWTDVPVFSGSTAGWTLQTSSSIAENEIGQLLIKTAKKASAVGTGTSVQTYSGIFIAAADANYLNLSTKGLFADNDVLLSIEPVLLDSDVLLDVTISIDSDMEYISAFFDINFEANNMYNINADWDTAPTFTSANEQKTAWKVQTTENRDVFGDDTVIYKVTAEGCTAPQSYRGLYHCETEQPVFNFFAQRLAGANEVHLTVLNAGNEREVSYISDFVSFENPYTVPKYVNGGVIQGFHIYDDVIFQCYDGGQCATYDFNTGENIATFPLGSEYSTNHCGNANFGIEFPAGNTQFPALYVSGDLTTKACYVESVSTTSSQLIQTIYFDINPSYSGGQVIVDKDRNRLIYMQRELSAIQNIGNRFKITEFRIPALSEGSEIHFTNADIIGEPFELNYYSPLYQGASIYRGAILQTHGLLANSFGSMSGIMSFSTDTHLFTRHIDLTNQLPYEPQSATVYKDRLIINFNLASGMFCELKVDLNIPAEGYHFTSVITLNNLVELISENLQDYLPDGYFVKSVEFPESFSITGEEQAFSADVVIQTPYNCQTVNMVGTINSST